MLRVSPVRGILVGLASVLVLVFLASAALVTASPAQDAVKGKDLWAASLCAKCHGDQGQGLFAGPRAGDTRTAEQWITQVRTPRAQMPAFSAAKVPDQDIRDMNEYMKTLPAVTGFTAPQAAAKPGDLPGKLLIAQKRCIACHGENGPINNFQSTNRVPTAALVLTQLRTPRNNMPMFSATQVTDAEATQIAEFLASTYQATPAAAATAAPAAPAAPAAAAPAAPAAPAALPRTGDSAPVAAYVVGIGVALVAIGLGLRRRLGMSRE